MEGPRGTFFGGLEHDMKCPQCGTEMQSGIAVVWPKAGLLLTLLGYAGLNSFQHLWFVSGEALDEQAARRTAMMSVGRGKADLVLKAAQPGRAWACSGCKTTVIVGGGLAEPQAQADRPRA